MSEYPGYTSPNVPQPPTPSPPPTPPPAEAAPVKQRNTVGLAALITAVVGFIFACIPGALIVGWILLPVAFVLSIVGLAMSGKKKGTSIAAIIISIVGFIVGVLVFLFVVGSAIDDAFKETESEIIAPTEEPADAASDDAADDVAEDDAAADAANADAADADDAADEAPAGDAGSRSNPIELGSTIRGKEWDVTILSFEHDATEQVLAANQFNDPPADGSVYALVEAEVTYNGDESGHPWIDISFAYVTESGNTVKSYDAMVVGPSPKFNEIGELYEGASGSGFFVLEVPKDDAGVLRVSPGFFAKDVFVATK